MDHRDGGKGIQVHSEFCALMNKQQLAQPSKEYGAQSHISESQATPHHLEVPVLAQALRSDIYELYPSHLPVPAAQSKPPNMVVQVEVRVPLIGAF
jgi:hypothetical protein